MLRLDSSQETLLRACFAQGDAARDAWLVWKSQLSSLDPDSERWLPRLYANLSAEGIRDGDEIGILARIHANASEHNRDLLQNARSVMAALRAEGIDFIVLKGAALGALYYEDPAERPMRDVDLLVREEYLSAAFACLAAQGFTSVYGEATRLDYLTHIGHACGFESQSGAQLDLHWHLMLQCPLPQLDRRFWDARVPLRLGDITTYALCPTDQLFHVCAHGVLGRAYNDESSLYWVADALSVLTRAGDRIDPERVAELASEARCRLALRDAFELLETLLAGWGRSLPGALGDSLEGRVTVAERIEAGTASRSNPRVRRLLNLTSQYLRLRGRDEFRSLPRGFVRFLRYYWRLERDRDVAPELLRKMLRQLRGLLGPSAR